MRKPQMQDQPKPPFSKQKLEQPGLEASMDDEPEWQAAFVFFASDADSSYITGEVLAQLGGDQT